MAVLITRLNDGALAGTLAGDEQRFARRLFKAIDISGTYGPAYPSLQCHAIDALTERYSTTVYQLYLENHTPAAGRMFWVYGPLRGQITVIGVEPHPEDTKSRASDRVALARLPDVAPTSHMPNAGQRASPKSSRRHKR